MDTLPEEVDAGSTDRKAVGLIALLRRLDRRLERAVVAAAERFGPEAALDRFRGLHIGEAEVVGLLARAPGEPTLWDGAGALEESWREVKANAPLAWLEHAFGLTPFDLDVILIALAPEVDLRYERLYAYLQDNVARRRPTVELILNLLCPSAGAKLDRRAHFAIDAPLLRHRLVHLIADTNQVGPPLLARYIQLDEQIVDVLLGQPGLDRRLASFCQVVVQVEQSPAERAVTGLVDLVREACALRRPLRLYFHGPDGAGQGECAESLAGAANAPLLIADLARVPLENNTTFRETMMVLFREALLRDAVLYLDNGDVLRSDERPIWLRDLLEEVANAPGVTILAGTRPWAPIIGRLTGIITVPFGMPEVAQRRVRWQAGIEAVGLSAASEDLDALAGRFRLMLGQIDEAVLGAVNLCRWQISEPESSAGDLQNLFAAARAQAGAELAGLARKVSAVNGWDDLVLPDDTRAQLRELCARVACVPQVLDEWGFGRRLAQGKGTTALFAGPSGTGKTMAAQVVAGDLGLDLYRIDLSGVVSKYIGETEKNLDRIFRAAENANAILFFDEADALFGKRSEVRDSHDRYANLEISFLLQKMEEYEGLAILATNLRQNLDEAFVRRLAFTVAFPSPDETSRRRIWGGIWPDETPLADDVNLDHLARQFKLSGGNIKNVALAAGFTAAHQRRPVAMLDLLHAIRREYQKLGKTLTDEELRGSLERAGA